MIEEIPYQLAKRQAGIIQKIWVSDEMFNAWDHIPNYSENGHIFTFKEIWKEGFCFRIFKVSEIGEMLLMREKNENIDNEIENCKKNCDTEYDECCKKWKPHWEKYDEALHDVKGDFDEYIQPNFKP